MILKRISSKKGFSLSETLMTVLLMSIVLLAITSGASTIQNSYKKVTSKADALTLLSTVTTSINADLRTAVYRQDINKEGDTSCWFYSDMHKSVMTVKNAAAASGSVSKPRIVYKMSGSSNETVVASEGIYTGRLGARFTEDLKYENGRFSYEIEVFQIGEEDTVLASANVVIRVIDS